MKELDGQNDFSVHYNEARSYAVLCRLLHKGTSIGVVCVSGDIYTWQGSDESPVEKGWHVVITLSYAPRMDTSMARVTVDGESSMDKGIADFEAAVAKVLKELIE